MEIVLASGNRGKLAEFAELFKGTGFTFRLMGDFPEARLPEETGKTFEENALLKARTVSAATGHVALADDSGLVVDALDGAPGVYSARYAGEPCDYDANNQKLLRELAGKPNRSARFHTVIALSDPHGNVQTLEGSCKGTIIAEPRGENGFGYDPLFVPDGHSKTFAELESSKKNRISHRANALHKAREQWAGVLRNISS